ncbi:MAG: putative quinol monooxygenase [Thermomicrobiales bacterium]
MTYANYGRIGAASGQRDAAPILTRPSPELAEVGCLLYDVGVSDDDPDGIHIVELWTSQEAHRQSLQLESVQASIKEAMPLISGAPTGHGFTVVGSPV